jgi:Flp pilus assembly protein TadD
MPSLKRCLGPIILCCLFPCGLRAQVRAWEGVLDLPTYEEGSPDPNPPFDQFATNRFNYPYTLRNEITNARQEHHWRAIYLENEYLKCSVLPDIGGHLYTCMDKISGQPLFYANPSIKKARIGYRGAWAAFGVEFNFPVSHNWVSMSPVSFAYTAHPDGSASVIVGNIDRPYGMEWSVELTLRPGSTVLEQHVTLSNRSDVRHRFYWWNNAGVQVWDDSHIEYPMRFAAAHGFAEVQKWPIDSQNKDLSIIRNQTDGPVSLFVHGSRENFMAVWNPHSNTGTAHFADYTELPAKKIWSWGVDADGLDWRDALSDNKSAYVELQAGLFRNQETYAFLEPRQNIAFTEYWMPVRGTGGISRANLAAVVHLQRDNDVLTVSLNPNQKIPSALIQVSDSGTPLLNEKADLAPEQLWKKQIQTGAARKCTFELKRSDGVVLLKQTEGEYDWTPESQIKVGRQASYVIPPENSRSEDDWLQLGATQELNGDKLSATQTYRDALLKFPNSFELAKAAGRLYVTLNRFEEALPLLSRDHDRNTTDTEISYLSGIAYDGLSQESHAADSYEQAMHLPVYRAAAALRLAELRARQGDLSRARDLLQESLRAAPDDLRVIEELAALRHALQQTGPADELAPLARYPLSDFLHEELGKPNLAHLAADPYRVLNIASEYARLGLYARAIEILTREYPSVPADQAEPGAVLPQNHPLVVYFRGYCRQKLGQSAAEDFGRASQLSTAYIFPNTVEDHLALQAAIRVNDNDATAHYLLGTWFFARGETDPALTEWSHARKLNPRIPVLNADIGLALLHIKRDFTAGLDVFDEGISTDPTNPVNYSGALAASALLNQPPADRVKILERFPDPAHLPTDLLYDLALNRAEAGDYDAAINTFRNRFFGREEGGLNVRQVWIEVRLQQALDLSRSKRCDEAVSKARALGSPVPGLGFTQDGLQPYVDSPRTNLFLGEVFAACGQKNEADQRYRLAANAARATDIVWAWISASKLAGYDEPGWKKRLTTALSQADINVQANPRSSSAFYSLAMLQLATGHRQQFFDSLRESLLLPDIQMSHHLARISPSPAMLGSSSP